MAREEGARGGRRGGGRGGGGGGVGGGEGGGGRRGRRGGRRRMGRLRTSRRVCAWSGRRRRAVARGRAEGRGPLPLASGRRSRGVEFATSSGDDARAPGSSSWAPDASYSRRHRGAPREAKREGNRGGARARRASPGAEQTGSLGGGARGDRGEHGGEEVLAALRGRRGASPTRGTRSRRSTRASRQRKARAEHALVDAVRRAAEADAVGVRGEGSIKLKRCARRRLYASVRI